MKASIPARCGEPYTIEKRGRLLSLSRKIGKYENKILLSHDDAIHIANKLIDIIEQDKRV